MRENRAGRRSATPARQLWAAALSAALAMAAQAEDDIFFSDLPIVASVSRLPQRLADAPTAVTVIDREIIRASGARDLNDIFRLVPGFQTYPNNTDAARVTYHGITDEEFSPRVQVLIDGRSQYSPLFRNGVNWATVPVALEDIERIEVVRGTNSASYGTNAFLGVINIITVDPAVVRGISVVTNRGTQNVRDYTLRAGGRVGEAGDFRFTYQQKSDSGLKDQFDWKDSLASRLFDLRSDFQITDRDELQFSLGHLEAVTTQGRLLKTGNGAAVTTQSDPSWPIHDFSQSNTYLQFLWRRVLGADADLNVRYSYARDWASDRYLSLSSNLLYNKNVYGDSSTRHELEAQHTFRPADAARLVWGGSYRWDTVHSEQYFYGNPAVDRLVGRVFGNLEWKPVTWFTGNAGVSAEHDSLAGYSASPRVSAGFHLTPENTVRLGYARATRTGSIVDYKGDRRDVPINASGVFDRKFLGNPDMPSEKLESVELGYLGDWRDIRMSLDVRVYHEKIPNRLFSLERTLSDPALCEVLTVGGSCTAAKADFTTPAQRIRIEGVEYQWRWQPFDTTRLMLSQAFTRIYADYLPAMRNDASLLVNGIDWPKLARIDLLGDRSAPRHATSLLWIQKLPGGFEFSSAGYWQDRMKWTQNSESYSYSRIDVRLGYPFRWGGVRGELAYTAQSLTGPHGEFKANGLVTDRIVERRDWLTLRLDL